MHARDDRRQTHQVARGIAFHFGTDLGDLCTDLMPQDDRIDVAGGGTTEEHASIGSTDPTTADAEQQVLDSERRQLNRLKPDILLPIEKSSLHDVYSFRGSSEGVRA